MSSTTCHPERSRRTCLFNHPPMWPKHPASDYRLSVAGRFHILVSLCSCIPVYIKANGFLNKRTQLQKPGTEVTGSETISQMLCTETGLYRVAPTPRFCFKARKTERKQKNAKQTHFQNLQYRFKRFLQNCLLITDD